jgi:hypothetical protein
MNEKKFPWNPHGFIRPSVEHLFGIKAQDYRTGRPTNTPTPASQFTIGKSNPARTAQISKARI